MGQNASNNNLESFIPDALDVIKIELKKHTKVLSEISSLKYEDFQKCLTDLNDLSRKCLDSNGRQLVFAVKKGSDSTVLWKGTVRVACVKIDPATRKIDNFKLLNLKQFLQVFKTFEQHLQAMDISEVKQQQLSASVLFEHFDDYCGDASDNTSSNNSSAAASPAKRVDQTDQFTECSICMDRQPEVLLPCAHLFCCPCIEQWNMTNKTCPICSEELTSTQETWILEDMPKAEEVSEEICTSLMGLSVIQDKTSE